MSGVIINEDNSHYFFFRGVHSPEPEELQKLVDYYCRGAVTEVAYNINAMRASVGGLPFEPIWQDVEDRGEAGLFLKGKPVGEHYVNWIRGQKKCFDLGLDPYVFWIKETRKAGRRAAISIRMNDIHSVDEPDNVMHSAFWRQHPEFRREPGMPHGWFSQALDFSHDEVCEYTLRMIQAVLERYDLDELELDWMRFGQHSAPGMEDVTREKITQLMRQTREAADAAAKRLGHPVDLAVRCQSLPQEAFDNALDVVGWAKAGWLARVTPTPFFNAIDMEIPVAFWKTILPETVKVAAGIDILIRSNYNCEPIWPSPATVAAMCANYLSQGADGIYFFNYMDQMPELAADFDRMMEYAGSLEKSAAAERRHIVTFQDSISCGSPVAPRLPLPLAAEGDLNCLRNYLRVEIGPKPAAGRRVELVIGLDGAVDGPVATMNNAALPLLSMAENPRKKPEDELPAGTAFPKLPVDAKMILRFDAAQAVKAGRNTFYITNGSLTPVKIVWAELHILPA